MHKLTGIFSVVWFL